MCGCEYCNAVNIVMIGAGGELNFVWAPAKHDQDVPIGQQLMEQPHSLTGAGSALRKSWQASLSQLSLSMSCSREMETSIAAKIHARRW